MKRDIIVKRKSGEGFDPPDDPFFEERPLVAEACCDPIFEDGSPREGWTISLSWAGPYVTLSLSDKQGRRSLNTTAPTVGAAMNAMEGLLSVPIRPWRYWGKEKRG